MTCKPCPKNKYNHSHKDRRCLPCTNCTFYRRSFEYQCRRQVDAECGPCLPGWVNASSTEYLVNQQKLLLKEINFADVWCFGFFESIANSLPGLPSHSSLLESRVIGFRAVDKLVPSNEGSSELSCICKSNNTMQHFYPRVN